MTQRAVVAGATGQIRVTALGYESARFGLDGAMRQLLAGDAAAGAAR